MTTPPDPTNAEPPTPPEPAVVPLPPTAPPVFTTPYPDPTFAPAARAPRVPWINPARRTAVIVVSIVAALVLLGAGTLIGWAATGNDSGHGRQFARFGPGQANGQPGGFYGPGGGGGGFGHRQPGAGPQRGSATSPATVPGGPASPASPASPAAPTPSTSPSR